MNDISAAILAGGKNLRMHCRKKAFIKIDDKYLIQRIIELFKNLFVEVLLVTDNPADFQQYKKDITIVKDIVNDIGPLGGIYSALTYAKNKTVFIVACDMPYISKYLIHKILKKAAGSGRKCCVPYTDKGLEPLCAVYHKGVIGDIERVIKTGNFSIGKMLKELPCKYLKLDNDELKFITNLNSINELVKTGLSIT